MKTIKSLLLASALLLSVNLQSQMVSQAYWVHEDRVKPSMVDEYEAMNKKLIENLKKHNVKDEQWITAQTADFRYLYVGPLQNMADLDRQAFSTLAEKMGSENMGKMFGEMDNYYTQHFNYVIHLDPDLSYMPSGMTQTPAGKNYRKFYYLHTTPAMVNNLAQAMKGIRDLYTNKGSKEEYRVYRSGFGAPGDFFMVAVAGEDAVSYEQSSMANQALLGEAAKPAFDKVMDYVTKFEVIPGNMRPDMAYNPE